MIALAKVPGMNAMALFHDRWAVSWEMDAFTTKATIAPAIVLTYLGATAVVDNASTRAITDAAIRLKQSSSADAGSQASTEPEPGTTSPGAAPVPPPTIRQVKPEVAELETLLCDKGDSFRAASVIPGKQPGDLQCMIISETNGVANAPYYAQNTPDFCARQLILMGEQLTKEGWDCKGR